jgi:epoxyqueuosine reductase
MPLASTDLEHLARQIKTWGRELGFQQTAIAGIDLKMAGDRLREWLAKGYQGDMAWMAEHGEKRWHPDQLLPGTARVIALRMDYLPPDSNLIAVLRDSDKAYLSRYALGRDYHKLIRKRLATLTRLIKEAAGESVVQRPFVDSAPVLEKPLAEKAGLGWMGKHTLILNSEAGSWFFLGEIYTSLPLPVDAPDQPDRCGSCSACLNICPTDAFPRPYELDARRCISYLTIEHKGAIPEELRPLMGNRVFGCDDCQAICPWNRFARPTDESDFHPRHGLADARLVTLFRWTEAEFLEKTAGSPIRRIGYERWQRNLAVGLGNGSASSEAVRALAEKRDTASPLVREHIDWALENLRKQDTRAPGPKPFPLLN